jgi:hypothetical protein
MKLGLPPKLSEQLVWVPVILLCKIFIPNYVFDALLCWNWPFSPPNRRTAWTTLLFTFTFVFSDIRWVLSWEKKKESQCRSLVFTLGKSLQPQALLYNSYVWVRIRKQIVIWVCIYMSSPRSWGTHHWWLIACFPKF